MASILPFPTRRPTLIGAISRHAPVAPLPSGAGLVSAGRPEARQSAALYAPLKRHLEPAEIYRALGDVHPGLYASFRHEPTWTQELAEDWRAFVGCVRAHPYSHAAMTVLGTLLGFLIVVVPAVVIAAVVL